MPLLVLFIAIPMIEIALFIKVGGLIGLWPTLGIVLLTAILGTWLMRRQGARELANLRSSFQELRDPSEPLANGAMILFAGALLLTPGFFTDLVGLLLLLPPVRQAVFRYFRNRFTLVQTRSAMSGAGDDTVIDAEFTVVDASKRPTHHPSGWTKH